MSQKSVNFTSESKKQQLLLLVKVNTCTKYIFIDIKFQKESKIAKA